MFYVLDMFGFGRENQEMEWNVAVYWEVWGDGIFLDYEYSEEVVENVL